jgi:hypothetical protein
LVVVVGVTATLPFKPTGPTLGAIVTPVAFIVDQFNVDDWPAEMFVGLAKQLVTCTPAWPTVTVALALSWLVAFLADSV